MTLNLFSTLSETEHNDTIAVPIKEKESCCKESFPDRYMALDTEPLSNAAQALVERLANAIYPHMGRTYGLTSKLRDCVGVTLAELLANAAISIETYGFRPMSRDSFTGLPVGYLPFKAVIDALQAGGLLDVIVGERCNPSRRKSEGVATRFRAQPALFELAIGYGVTPANWDAHFRQLPRIGRISNPILLRSSSKPFMGRKLPGTAMKVDKSLPVVQSMAAVIHDINEFNASQELDLGKWKLRYLQRIFGQGELSAHRFNKGGRLYAPGVDSYQQAPSKERATFRFNGEPTVEVDIGSSFLTIFRVKNGIGFDPAADPYAIPDVPRFVSKSWVCMTFGHDRHHTRWPQAVKTKYRRKHEEEGGPEWGTGNLQADHPYGLIYPKMLTAFPDLADWADNEMTWGDLQYVESLAVVEAVHALAMVHRVPALPIHDSIRVPVSKHELSRRMLSQAFTKHVGVEPIIKIK